MSLHSVILTGKKIAGCCFNIQLLLCTALLSIIHLPGLSQEENIPGMPSIAISPGIMNYQGDLNPNSFTWGRSKFTIGATLRQPLTKRWVARAGINVGSLEAADRYNRDYLQSRNLSFYTAIQEAHLAIEYNFFAITKTRFTPYLYAGFAVFHFNPWAYDNEGHKTYLHPLSTEGEGLASFPGQKPYKLTQAAIPFGAGVKYALNDCINIGIEISQRKTFTDYLDDVSSFYVDYHTLMAAKGPKAVEMAYRGLVNPASSTHYPAQGEQRGTPSEMDWYYFTGFSIEIKFGTFSHFFNTKDRSYQQRCPGRVL